MISPIVSQEIPDIIYPSERGMDMQLTDTQRNKLFGLPFAKRSWLSLASTADRQAVARGEMSEAEYRARTDARTIAAIQGRA